MLSVVSNFDLEVAEVGEKVVVCNLVARPTLLQRVIEVLLLDVELAEIVRRHGVPLPIVSDRDPSCVGLF